MIPSMKNRVGIGGVFTALMKFPSASDIFSPLSIICCWGVFVKAILFFGEGLRALPLPRTRKEYLSLPLLFSPSLHALREGENSCLHGAGPLAGWCSGSVCGFRVEIDAWC